MNKKHVLRRLIMNFLLVYVLLITLFYTIYFLKQISLKKQKIDTNRLGKGSKPKNVVVIERSLLLLTYFTALFQYLSVFHFHFMIQLSNVIIIEILGTIVTIIGVLVFLLATINMKENWRAGIDKSQKTELITNGVYQYSRNPAFVGFDLFYIGIVLMSPSILLIISSVLVIICLHLQILEEEKYLANTFGHPYIIYKNKVRRYF